MVFISVIKEKRGIVPAAISTQDVEEALIMKDLRNSVLHYKHVCYVLLVCSKMIADVCSSLQLF